MSDDSMAESVLGDDGSSDFVPEEAPVRSNSPALGNGLC